MVGFSVVVGCSFDDVFWVVVVVILVWDWLGIIITVVLVGW